MIRSIAPAHLRSRALVSLLLSGAALTGCVGRSVTEEANLPLASTALATVTGTPPASILAVGGTQQLSATGTTFVGASVTTFDSVLYRFNTASDSTRVRLSASGLMTAVGSSGAASFLITILGFKDAAVRGDQVVVQVTPTAIAGSLTFSIQPVAPDSTKLAVGATKTIVPVLRNPMTGTAVTNPAVRYTIRGTDSSRVDVFRGKVQYCLTTADCLVIRQTTVNTSLASNQVVPLSGEGSAWLYATVNAYGTILQDSVQYSFTYPYAQTISTVKANLAVQSIYAYQTLVLAPGATVTFQNGVSTTDPLTVTYTFDNPAAATAATSASTIGGASGNITTLTGGQTSLRRFLTAGTVHWTVTPTGGPAPWPGQMLTGTIVIK